MVQQLWELQPPEELELDDEAGKTMRRAGREYRSARPGVAGPFGLVSGRQG